MTWALSDLVIRETAEAEILAPRIGFKTPETSRVEMPRKKALQMSVLTVS